MDSNTRINETIITRQELYDIVWSTTLSKLTLQYAYTNDGIKKICKQFEIPMPDGSYWSKLKFNKKFKKEKLNPVFSGVDKIVLTIREEGNTVNIDQTPLTIRTKEIESDPKAPLIVPEKLTKPDILIQNTKSYHQSRKNKDFVRNDKLDTVHIYVEEANYNRALNIMDSFIKLLRHRGHSFRRDINNYGPKIVAYDVEFSWNIREKTKRILSDKIYETATYIPTGILILQIGESFRAKEWVDGATKLENRLSKVVAKIELDALKELEWREECRLSDIRRAEEERIRKIFEARKEKEVVKTRKLFTDAKKFDKATMYRNFIKATEQKAITENNLTEELKEWIKWAYDKADWIDPTSPKQDELLNDNDIDEIENPKKTNYYFR
jgi:hypothetical protein